MKSTELNPLTNAALLGVLHDVLTGRGKLAPTDAAALHEQFQRRLVSTAIPKWLTPDPTTASLRNTLFASR